MSCGCRGATCRIDSSNAGLCRLRPMMGRGNWRSRRVGCCRRRADCCCCWAGCCCCYCCCRIAAADFRCTWWCSSAPEDGYPHPAGMGSMAAKQRKLAQVGRASASSRGASAPAAWADSARPAAAWARACLVRFSLCYRWAYEITLPAPDSRGVNVAHQNRQCVSRRARAKICPAPIHRAAAGLMYAGMDWSGRSEERCGEGRDYLDQIIPTSQRSRSSPPPDTG
jgi:hypothetical protein